MQTLHSACLAVIAVLLAVAVGAAAQVSDGGTGGGLVPGQTPPILVDPPDSGEGSEEPAKTRGKLGRRCRQDDQCRSGRCSTSIAPEASGGRRARLTEAIGGRRSRLPEKPVSGVCIKADGTARVGQFCTETAQCKTGICADGRCVVEELGASCSVDRACRSGLCQDELCVPPPGTGADGDFCTMAPQCASTRCRQGVCVASSNIEDYEPCVYDNECQSGACTNAFCSPLNNTVERGGRCSWHDDCAGDLVCNKSLLEPTCGDPYSENGESCVTQGVVSIIGHPHNPAEKNQCISQRCDFDTRKCIPNDGEGIPGTYCSHDNHCQTGGCLDNECSEALSNQPLGGACIGDADCQSARCDSNSDTCVPDDGTAEEGAYCANDNHCVGLLVCSDGSCTPPNVPLGEYCGGRDKDPCVEGSCNASPLDAERNLCLPDSGTSAVGEFCTRNDQCATQLCGPDGTCVGQGPLAAGETCSSHTNCVHGRCDPAPRPGQPRRCIPNDGTGVLGEYCSHDHHCLGGFRCAPDNVAAPDLWVCQK